MLQALDDPLSTLQESVTSSPSPELGRSSRLEHLAGPRHLQPKRFGEAIDTLTTATRFNPVRVEVSLDLCRAYEARGDLDGALASLDRVLAVPPEHVGALQRRNALLVRLEARLREREAGGPRPRREDLPPALL